MDRQRRVARRGCEDVDGVKKSGVRGMPEGEMKSQTLDERRG